MKTILLSIFLCPSLTWAIGVGTSRGVTNSGSSFVGSLAHTLTATPTLGNLIVIGIGQSNVNTVSSVADNFSNAYTQVACNTNRRSFCFYFLLVPAGISGTYTVIVTLSGGTSLMTVGAIEYTNTLTSSIFNTSQASDGASGSPACTGITTSVNNEAVLVGFYDADASNVAATPPSGMTALYTSTGSGPRASQTADVFQGTAGATGTLTWGTSWGATTWGCLVTGVKLNGPIGTKVARKVSVQ